MKDKPWKVMIKKQNKKVQLCSKVLTVSRIFKKTVCLLVSIGNYAMRHPRMNQQLPKPKDAYHASVWTRLLGVFVYFCFPFSCAYYSVNLTMNFINQIILVAFMSQCFSVAGFASKYCFFNVPRMFCAMLKVNKHSIATRAESPSIMGVITNV